MPPPARIPPEIVDIIIDNLVSDHRSLRSCTFVARAWLPRSRFYLFQHISVTASRLRRFLERCETFGSGVHSLAFRASAGPWLRTTALLCDKTFSGSFSSYTSLTSLEISGFKFPAFSHLTHLISTFSRLEKLALLDVTWIQYDCGRIEGNFSSLRHLSISIPALGTILDWFHHHDLRSLDSVAFTLLDANSNTQILAFLHKLRVTQVEIGPPRFQLCRDLVLRISEQHPLVVHFYVELADTARSVYVLRRPINPIYQYPIKINQISATVALCHVISCCSREASVDWAGLDILLSGRQFSFFDRIVMLVDGEYTQEQVREHLPTTKRRGVLVFSQLRGA